MGKVTNEMMRAGSKAYLDEAMQVSHQATCDWGGLLAAYLAMREARPRKTRPVAAEKPVVDRQALVNAMWESQKDKPHELWNLWEMADAAIAAMGAELSEELAALRARCERLTLTEDVLVKAQAAFMEASAFCDWQEGVRAALLAAGMEEVK